MSSKIKIILLTSIITLGFLARDTFMIDGPIEMMPTYIIFFASLILSFFLIILSENKKTHNHRRTILASVSLFVAMLSILLAYILNPFNYQEVNFLTGLLNSLVLGIGNIVNNGFWVILSAALFGLLAGSNKNLRTTYTYKSSKHTEPSKGKRYKK